MTSRTAGVRGTAAGSGRHAARRPDRPRGATRHHAGRRERRCDRQFDGGHPVVERRAGVGLSPAGEQYIDFVADSDDGPYLRDGSVIAQDSATVPVSLAQLLANADGTLAQVDTAKLELIKRELSMSDDGPQKLADIIDGGTFLLSTLDSVLPETTSMLRTSRVVLTLAADKNAGIDVGDGEPQRDASTVSTACARATAGSPNRHRAP